MAKAKAVSFKISAADSELVDVIMYRYLAMRRGLGIPTSKRDRIDIQMDIVACHANGNRLDLRRLLDADDFNFAHDVTGIMRHIDRTTGELTDFFVPRFSAPKKKLRGRTSRADKRAAAHVHASQEGV